MSKDQAPALEAYEAYAEIYDDFNHLNDYEMWIGEILLPKLLGHGLKTPGMALDVACGTGRAFSPLLERGWKIWGCDVSPAMVAIAKKRFGDQVRLSVADMRSLPTIGKFDLILVMNDAVNHLLTLRDLHQTMAGIAANLQPGGLLLFDCNTRALFRKAFAATVSHAVERNGRRWIWQGMGKNGRTFRVQISGDFIDPVTITERHFLQLEVEAAMKASDLTCRAVFGQRETDGRVLLSEEPDEERDDKVIYVASHQN